MEEFRFECQPGCSACCEVEGYVYLTEDDLLRAAQHLAITPAEFEQRYVYRTRHLLRLRKPKVGQCHFLVKDENDHGLCSIHPNKPAQCRLFPFWPEIVETRQSWHRTSKTCPGIGKGELIQIGTAVEIANGMRTAYPTMYQPVETLWDRKSSKRRVPRTGATASDVDTATKNSNNSPMRGE
jgi:Fe-S-cluster containining protein